MRSIVKDILTNNKEARNNDKVLMWLVWREQGLAGDNIAESLFINEALSPETIRRSRQKVQEIARNYLRDEHCRQNLFKNIEEAYSVLPDKEVNNFRLDKQVKIELNLATNQYKII